jgi:tRNA-5-taurinomethyluridine 2-sulfurtransferase
MYEGTMNIAVLVSGGVDSSVALRLLQEQGHSVTAFYLKIWLEDEFADLGNCPWEEDLAYVRAVCEQAGVPLEVVSLQQEYWAHVVSYTINQIKIGLTPNPDVFCNSLIKFGFFLERLDPRFDKVASGHYARIEHIDDRYVLKLTPDPIKDQTYFLSYLTQKQLSRVLFPLGHLNKTQVREEARRFDLPNKDRKDSQGICFLGKVKFSEFVRQHLGDNPGNLVEFESGMILGQHNGFWFYTIGQRQGIGLSGGPWYVVAKDTSKNIVYISRTYYADDKLRDTFVVEHVNWIGGMVSKTDRLRVKLRHGAPFHACTVQILSTTKVRVNLVERDQGIAPGQFAVFYNDDSCLGAGVIASGEPV